MACALANPVEMIRHGAPRLIQSADELAEYTEALFALTAKAKPTKLEQEAIELLTVLIDRYESEYYPIPDASPINVLRYLMDSNGSHNEIWQPNLAVRARFPS